MRVVHGQKVYGVEVDAKTRCGHWQSPIDIIAVRFKCCGRWYPCFDCHTALAGHEPDVWPAAEFHEKAILCGACGHQLAIGEYLESKNCCPSCAAAFNPGCSKHYHFYFRL